MSKIAIWIGLLSITLICACSSQKAVEGERYRKLSAMNRNSATRFIDLQAYADSVAAATADADLRLVAEYTSVGAQGALLLNYGTVGHFDASGGLVGDLAKFVRGVLAMFTKGEEYTALFHKALAFDQEQVKAAEARCKKKYL